MMITIENLFLTSRESHSAFALFNYCLHYAIKYDITIDVSKREKLFKKICSNPKDVRFSEICEVAESFGFRRKVGKGSHVAYMRDGVTEILNFQDVDGKVKPYQVRQFLDLIEKYSLLLSNREVE